MARMNIEVKVKKTETFSLLITMRQDIEELIDLVPDYLPEKQQLLSSLNDKWCKMRELVEVEKQ